MPAERPIDAIIDHAASLQQQVDQLAREVQTVALACLFLAVGVMVMSYRLWHGEP